MPDSFFAAPKQRKRKRTDSASGSSKRPARGATKDAARTGTGKASVNGKKKRRDEELSDETDEEGGVDDMDLRAEEVDVGSGEEDEEETPAEKRLRLARMYLESVKEGLADGEFDAKEIDKELIAARLKQDVLEHSGKVHLFVADQFDFSRPPAAVLHTRGHRFSVTSAVVSESATHLFTAGKEGHIVQWDLLTGKKKRTFFKTRPPADADTGPDALSKSNPGSKSKGKGKNKAGDERVHGHTDEVLALAMSGDGSLLASAGRDRRVCVWDVATGEWMRSFGGHLGHKDAISGLAFRKGTQQLYTASLDRTLKVYDLSSSVMGYVETLFGHQDHVLALDALRGETCVSVGGRDKTVRFWKIVDETQLVFRGGGRSRVREVLEGGLRGDDEEGGDDEDREGDRKKTKGKGREEGRYIEGSIESVAMIDETLFVSGGDSGSICLWTTTKKKPIFTQALAHGLNEAKSESEGVIRTPRWITSLASLRYSDIFVSGSWEGDVRIWKLDAKLKSFALVGTVSVPGVVNSLQVLPVPQRFKEDVAWAPAPGSAATSTGTAAAEQGSEEEPVLGKRSKDANLTASPFIIVAGVGQEHRLGRWLSIKGDGACNGSVVALFTTQTKSATQGH